MCALCFSKLPFGRTTRARASTHREACIRTKGLDNDFIHGGGMFVQWLFLLLPICMLAGGFGDGAGDCTLHPLPTPLISSTVTVCTGFPRTRITFWIDVRAPKMHSSPSGPWKNRGCNGIARKHGTSILTKTAEIRLHSISSLRRFPRSRPQRW